MAEDFVSTLFTEARANYDAARRWFAIAVVGAAVFHVLIFHPYVTLSREKSDVALALVRETALRQELAAISPLWAALDQQGSAEAKRRLDALLGELQASFGRLNQIFAELKQLGPQAAAGDAGARLFRPAPSMMVQAPLQIPNMAVQAIPRPTPVPYGGGAGLPEMPADMRVALLGIGSRQAMLALIHPYIEQQIIDPRFAAFNRDWAELAVPAIGAAGEALRQRLEAAAVKFPDAAAQFAAAEQSVAAVLRAAQQFKVTAPAEPFWWAEAQGKGAAFQGFSLSLREASLQQGSALAELQRRAEAAISLRQQAQAAIEASIARLEAEFKEQQQAFAAMVEPLKGIAIDLGNLVPYVPLLLGLGFAGLTGWLAARVRQLGQCVDLSVKADPASLAPLWLRGRVAASPWHQPAAMLARGAILAAWVALASAELFAAGVGWRPATLLFGLVGMLAIAIAAAYEWRVMRALAAAPNPAPGDA